MVNAKSALVISLVAMTALAGCRQAEPVYNVSSASYGATASARQPSMTEVEQAIIRAGANRGWTFQRVAPGYLEGKTVVRGKHRATVDVAYSPSDFSILYKNSENLEYDPATNAIHPNYNSWISLLESDIRGEIQKI